MTRQEQKEKTRELLIQTAYKEFALRGILNTKTSDVAKAANVAHGTLFVHFPTRDDLLIAVVSEFGMKLGSQFNLLSRQGSGIREILTAYIQAIGDCEPFYARLLTESSALPAKVRNTLFFIQSGFAHHFAQVFQKELKQGTVRDLPLPFLLNTWMGLIYYYVRNRDLFAPESSVISVHGPELVHHFLTLIQK